MAGPLFIDSSLHVQPVLAQETGDLVAHGTGFIATSEHPSTSTYK
jgi:hypothetical protein